MNAESHPGTKPEWHSVNGVVGVVLFNPPDANAFHAVLNHSARSDAPAVSLYVVSRSHERRVVLAAFMFAGKERAVARHHLPKWIFQNATLAAIGARRGERHVLVNLHGWFLWSRPNNTWHNSTNYATTFFAGAWGTVGYFFFSLQVHDELSAVHPYCEPFLTTTIILGSHLKNDHLAHSNPESQAARRFQRGPYPAHFATPFPTHLTPKMTINLIARLNATQLVARPTETMVILGY